MKLTRTLLSTGVALMALAGVANADVSIGTGTAPDFIAGGSVGSNNLATPAVVQVTNVSPAALANNPTTAFTTALANGNTLTFTLNQGTFAVAPTVTAFTDAACTTGVAAGQVTISAGGAGASSVTVTLGSSAGAACVRLGGISVAGVSNTADSVNGSAPAPGVTVAVSSSALATVPASLLSAGQIIRFRAPVTVGSSSTTANITLASNNQSFSAGAALGLTNFAVATVTNYDGSAVTVGTPTVSLALPNYAANSLAAPTFAGTNAFAALTGAAPGTDGTVAVTGAAAAAASNDITPTLVDNASTPFAIGRGAVTLNYSFPITNNSGAPATFAGSRTVGTIRTLNGTTDYAVPYAFGNTPGFQFFVNVATPSAAPVRVQSGAFTAPLAASQSGSALYSIDTIRSALVANGAPSTILAAGTPSRIIISTATGSRVNPLIFNQQSQIVTEVGGSNAANEGATTTP